MVKDYKTKLLWDFQSKIKVFTQLNWSKRSYLKNQWVRDHKWELKRPRAWTSTVRTQLRAFSRTSILANTTLSFSYNFDLAKISLRWWNGGGMVMKRWWNSVNNLIQGREKRAMIDDIKMSNLYLHDKCKTQSELASIGKSNSIDNIRTE